LGSLLVALIIKTVDNSNLSNSTFNYALYCGSKNCPDTKLPEAGSVTVKESIYWLSGSLDALMIISILISLFFMDNIKEETNDNQIKSKKKISLSSIGNQFRTEFKNIFRLCTNLNIWLLFPMTVWTTFECTLIWFEFNRVFK